MSHVDFSHLRPNFKLRFSEVDEELSPSDQSVVSDQDQVQPEVINEVTSPVPLEMQQAYEHAQRIREQSLALTEMTAPVLFRVSEVLLTLFELRAELPKGEAIDRVNTSWDAQASQLAESLVSILKDEHYMNAEWLKRWGKSNVTAMKLKSGIRDHFLAQPTANDVPVELVVNAMESISPNEVLKKIKGRERALVRALSVIHARLSEEIEALQTHQDLDSPNNELTFSQALQKTDFQKEKQAIWFKQAQAMIGVYIDAFTTL
jgi:hypothetical protein